METPEVRFPQQPSATWGEVRFVAMQNPRWRWWRPWVPRVLLIAVETPYKALDVGDTLTAVLTVTER
ncbi:MAG: hypothetical protein U1F09_13265 [Steroidobacteraceae bacterium]